MTKKCVAHEYFAEIFPVWNFNTIKTGRLIRRELRLKTTT